MSILVRHEDDIAHVTLSDTRKRNALSPDDFECLYTELDAIAAARADRAVVISGAGTAFCAGASLPTDGPPEHPVALMRRIHRTALRLHQMPQPCIAAVNGPAYGAGMSLALGCDVVIASSTATFCQVFVKRGLSPDFGSTWLLPRIVGLHTAKRLAMLGDVITAVEAQDLGIVAEVHEPDELAHAATRWARRLAAGPPIALALTKELLGRTFETSFADALDGEAAASAITTGTQDVLEAFAAFTEKRDPVFRGQ